VHVPSWLEVETKMVALCMQANMLPKFDGVLPILSIIFCVNMDILIGLNIRLHLQQHLWLCLMCITALGGCDRAKFQYQPF
jgi:C4-dicarboxylate transporter